MRSVALFVCAFVAYTLLAGDALYAEDGFFILASLEARSCTRNLHEAFLPQLIAFGDLLSWLALPPHRVATLFSACGAALGVTLTHRALCVLEPGDRAAARRATALVVTAPAVVFFATVVEYHGFFFAYAQLALLCAAHLARAPGVKWAVGLGVAIAAATLVHSSGMFLPAVLLPLVLVEARSVAPTRRVALCGVAAVVSGVGAFGGRAALQAIFVPRPLALPGLDAALAGLPYVPHALLTEWLLPFAPVALGALLALRRAATRGLALWLWAAALVYALAASGALYDALWERGAYLLPLVGPAALLSVRSLQRAWVWVLVALGGAAAIVQVRVHASAAAAYPTFVQGVQEATAPAAPVALVLAQPERAAIAVLRPAWRAVDLRNVLVQDGAMVDATLAAVGAWLPALLPEGHRLLISDASLAELRAAGDHGVRLAAAILARCDARPVTSAGFRGLLLELRGR